MQMQELQRPVSGALVSPAPASQPHPRSPLGQITFSLAVLAAGVLGLVDLAGAKVPASAYFGVPLAVIGLGLLVGTWYGRARWLFGIGVVLAALLTITAAAESAGPATAHNTTWKPTSIDQVDGTYAASLGNGTLDLSSVNFAGQDKSIDVSIGAGNLTIIVGSNVDVTAKGTVNVGNANVFGTRWSGVGQSSHTVTDNGADGAGAGRLVLNASVDVGNLEVRR